MKSSPTDLDLFLRHRPALITYAATIVGCRARAEDIVQEAFINFEVRGRSPDSKIDTSGGNQPGIGKPASFFYRVVRNAAIDWLRRPDASLELVDVVELDRLPASAVTPEQAAEDREQLKILSDALATLPRRTQIAFRMHRLEGCGLSEIADALGISVVRAHQLVKDAIRHGATVLDFHDRDK